MLDWGESDDYIVVSLVITLELLSASVFWSSVYVCVIWNEEGSEIDLLRHTHKGLLC